MPQNKNHLTWNAPEFKIYHKNLGWYVTLIAITTLIIGFFVVVEKDYFAAITLAVVALAFIFFSRQNPQMVEIRLTEKGIHQGGLHVPYKQIKHFWVVGHEHHKTLNLETSAHINRLMIVELADQDPEIVRDFLLDYLPEHTETEPTFAQRLMHWLKF